MLDSYNSRANYLEAVVATDDLCSSGCEYRWGDNCAAHWVDGGFTSIVNDVNELNRLALDPTADVIQVKKSRPAQDLLLLEVRSGRYLITDYNGLEISITSRPWNASSSGNNIEFTRQ